MPYGEYVRAGRACSRDMTFEVEKCTINKRLKKRGYSKTHLNVAEKRINQVTQKNLLFSATNRGRNVSSTSTLVFYTQYSVDFNNINKIILKNLPILSSGDSLATILREDVRVVAKRNRTLGDLLSPSLFSSSKS